MIFKILANLGLIIRSVKALQSIIGEVISQKKFSKEILKNLLDVLENLLDSGVIDIPGVDEKVISDALKEVEANL